MPETELHKGSAVRFFPILCPLLLVGLNSCAIHRIGRLYPSNDIAAAGGVVEAKFTANGSGHGEGQFTMPSGEVLNGEFSIVRQGTIGFGSIFGAVYGPNGSANVSGTSMTNFIEGGSPGVASAFGNRGTSMSCEFYNDNWSGHGYGACKASTGTLYRLVLGPENGNEKPR
jgi:hypothetical protein